MSKLRVGINGFGRIGRTIFRAWHARQSEQFDIVGINDIADPKMDLHLLKYDSVHGRFSGQARLAGSTLEVDNHKIDLYHEKDPTKIAWDVDIVIDSTGIFKNKEGLGKHLKGRTKKVIMCAPGSDLDGTFVVGINHKEYDNSKHNIISNASCTTNCLAPIVKVLHDNFKVISGLMTTVHSYTGDQRLLDTIHSDPRRARSAALSMCPTTTGAARAIGLVIPELKGKLDGFAIRVPTPNVSLVDLTAHLGQKVSKEEVNSAMRRAASEELKGILGYTEEPLVSIDFMGQPESSFFDAALTNTIDNTVKVVSWYDNEVGFSNRVIDLTTHIGGLL